MKEENHPFWWPFLAVEIEEKFFKWQFCLILCLELDDTLVQVLFFPIILPVSKHQGWVRALFPCFHARITVQRWGGIVNITIIFGKGESSWQCPSKDFSEYRCWPSNIQSYAPLTQQLCKGVWGVPRLCKMDLWGIPNYPCFNPVTPCGVKQYWLT